MARKIDFSKPLSPEEQAYVADRPWLLEDARLRGEDIITDDEFTLDDDGDDETGSGNDEGGQESANSDSEDTGDDQSENDSEDDEDGDASGDDDTAEDDSEEEDGEGDEDEVAPYDEWDYQELKDEAKRRELSAGGSKEQLIKRLQEDDDSSPE